MLHTLYFLQSSQDLYSAVHQSIPLHCTFGPPSFTHRFPTLPFQVLQLLSAVPPLPISFPINGFLHLPCISSFPRAPTTAPFNSLRHALSHQSPSQERGKQASLSILPISSLEKSSHENGKHRQKLSAAIHRRVRDPSRVAYPDYGCPNLSHAKGQRLSTIPFEKESTVVRLQTRKMPQWTKVPGDLILIPRTYTLERTDSHIHVHTGACAQTRGV